MGVETKSTTVLEDVKIHVKLKISALWVSAMLCYIYGDILSFFRQDRIEGILAGNMGPLGPTTQGVLLGVAVFMAIPAVMVFLSLTLTPTVNRWVNVILGIIYTAVVLLTMLTGPWAYYMFLGIVEVILTGLIVWYAWTWPPREREGVR